MHFSKKTLLSLLLLFATQGYSEEPLLKSTPIIEAKSGYFFFTSSTMRQVYNDGVDVQLSSSIPFWQPLKRLSMNAYGSVEFLRCSGHSTGGHYNTYVWELPVNIGLKPVFLLSKHIQYYLALGPRYFFIRQVNSSPYVDKHNSRNGVGFFANTGFNFILCKHLVIDLFGEYSYAKTRFHTSALNVHTQSTQVGGLTFGGGLGYSF